MKDLSLHQKSLDLTRSGQIFGNIRIPIKSLCFEFLPFSHEIHFGERIPDQP